MQISFIKVEASKQVQNKKGETKNEKGTQKHLIHLLDSRYSANGYSVLWF
jgi:hypothetical protein